jgi:hypothetical protein
MKQNKSIAIVICYFGKFPWYFDFFVHSCSFNLDVDFLIITDNLLYNRPVPPNIKFVFKTLGEFSVLASEKLGFTIDIKFSYKLCDFKPAYGLIFSDFIEDYDYWGQSDIDIIYGNIRGFITDDMLSEFDFISVRHDYTTGCFALYKNSHFINNLFKRSKDMVKVFSGSKHYCFDECNFVQDRLTEGESIFDIETEIESFTHIIKTAESLNEIKAHFDFILLEGLPGKIKFDKGRIIYKKRFEGILYHLYWLKRIYNPPKMGNAIPDVYHISPKQIYFK